ncbi:hypothetical protein [Leifsonia soli]|uniref:Uncharacterized protein n=2 Tax=Leifsonia soli TaxID=582665 RepID=A0A852T134_9MICO|nr:hypothetical protein [Leifsonia soli]
MAVWVLFGPLIPEKFNTGGLFHSFYLLTGWLGTTIALPALTFIVQAIVQGIVEAPALKLIDETSSETEVQSQAGSAGGNVTATLPA